MDKPTEQLEDGTDDGWTQLHGGNVNMVARKGDVVRRQTHSASPAIHQLLTELHAQGFSQIPELVKVTAANEFLTFLPGQVVFRPWPAEIKNDAWMAQLGDWLWRYHRAVAGFRVQGAVSFLWGPDKPEPGMMVCHGDLGPWNCVQQDGKLVGVIDWDLARYGYPLDDVAELALEAVPLRPNVESTMGSDTAKSELRRRLEIFCEAYGVSQADVLQHLPNYLTKIVQDTKSEAARGTEPFISFVAGGVVEDLERDKAFVLAEWT